MVLNRKSFNRWLLNMRVTIGLNGKKIIIFEAVFQRHRQISYLDMCYRGKSLTKNKESE